MNPGYTHGWQPCQLCFQENEDLREINGWKLFRNPGYAGSSSPRILVLGFSKGRKQNEKAREGDYDKVPFADMRPRLQQVLEKLELMPPDRTIDDILTANEKEFGATSLVRCSLCKTIGDACITSGSIVTQCFTVDRVKDIIRRCTTTFLARPPESIELVILLGTNQVYIQRTRQLFKGLYGEDYQDINEVAFRARGALWLYAAHPSPANGHFESWKDAEPGNPSGRKCLLALKTLKA